ncbi:MAG: methyltransferase [Pseudomonadota bacterium]
MTSLPTDIPQSAKRSTGWLTRLSASRGFQKWAARFPLTRGIVRREGEAIFDLLAGFCHSQILMALVKLNVLTALLERPLETRALAHRCGVPEPRMAVLLNAGTALKLLTRKRNGTWALTQRGAALLGVPGLTKMIAHHDVLYRDLEDPIAFFRGEVDTELAAFWPYVFGGDMDPEVAREYSELMAQSQVLVAEDTLRAVSFAGAATLMDVGGGTGAFLEAVGQDYPDLQLHLFDLPEVVPTARDRFAHAGMSARFLAHAGSFKTDALPKGADAISLIRVLYDHTDETVTRLLAACFDALPSGGRLVISEPMSGGARPSRAGDAYFAIYTMAMGTGKARSPIEVRDLCSSAGFVDISIPKAARPFVTQSVICQKP